MGVEFDLGEEDVQEQFGEVVVVFDESDQVIVRDVEYCGSDLGFVCYEDCVEDPVEGYFYEFDWSVCEVEGF